MKSITGKRLAWRALWGFGIGILVCLVYWMTGLVPRDTWFDAASSDVFIRSKMWFWPGAVLDVVFREVRPAIAAGILYAINGLMYAAISLLLLALRDRFLFYLLACIAVLGSITWFNVVVMDTFSWTWLLAASALLAIVAYCDLHRSPMSELKIR